MLMDNSGTLTNNAAMLNLGSFTSSGTINNNGPLFNVGALTIEQAEYSTTPQRQTTTTQEQAC